MDPNFKALVFDLMGTCTDWSSSILDALIKFTSDHHGLESLTRDWREGFFAEIRHRFESGEPQENIDITHRRVLDGLLQQDKYIKFGAQLGERHRQELVQSWHMQNPWPDSIPGLQRLKQKYFIVVLANGTTRLQLDLIKSSGLPFHTLFSSQLLGLTKVLFSSSFFFDYFSSPICVPLPIIPYRHYLHLGLPSPQCYFAEIFSECSPTPPSTARLFRS
ncbi:hypothetical protein D9758_005382 [Tetrapyrgos nigripes]|uniref:Haloacid dehalogenase n=1 Tax=Tetrapyrgos nigripes TaxID=182062 RepID=A0A8H5LQ46_9AGAR|nr:hypothetical protein D9758_005382 [Tetrapyrgos nigripes]